MVRKQVFKFLTEDAAGAISKDPVADLIVRNYQVCAMLQSPAGWQFEYLAQKVSIVDE
jgi:hypothetical protein